jgi:hypothetical protein
MRHAFATGAAILAAIFASTVRVEAFGLVPRPSGDDLRHSVQAHTDQDFGARQDAWTYRRAQTMLNSVAPGRSFTGRVPLSQVAVVPEELIRNWVERIARKWMDEAALRYFRRVVPEHATSWAQWARGSMLSAASSIAVPMAKAVLAYVAAEVPSSISRPSIYVNNVWRDQRKWTLLVDGSADLHTWLVPYQAGDAIPTLNNIVKQIYYHIPHANIFPTEAKEEAALSALYDVMREEHDDLVRWARDNHVDQQLSFLATPNRFSDWVDAGGDVYVIPPGDANPFEVRSAQIMSLTGGGGIVSISPGPPYRVTGLRPGITKVTLTINPPITSLIRTGGSASTELVIEVRQKLQSVAPSIEQPPVSELRLLQWGASQPKAPPGPPTNPSAPVVAPPGPIPGMCVDANNKVLPGCEPK